MWMVPPGKIMPKSGKWQAGVQIFNLSGDNLAISSALPACFCYTCNMLKIVQKSASDATPMIAQFLAIKASNPDCLLFYRMGDFYELFFEDAEIASKALGIVLTKRGKLDGMDIPMCGVPIVRSDDYLQKLIGLGHRVAVCEQVEDPAEAKKRGSKSVVRRDVIRLVTPGTITEEQLLEPRRASSFVALARQKLTDETWLYALASVDISTGAFQIGECPDTVLQAELARLEPREVVFGEALNGDAGLKGALADLNLPYTAVAFSAEPEFSNRKLCAYYGVATLEGFGNLSRAQIAACALALTYVEKTQFGSKPMLAVPVQAGSGTILHIDAATRANLELTRRLSGEREGSLLASIDRTVTPLGARLLAEHLAGPLMDITKIVARQDAVAWFHNDSAAREDVRKALKQMPDMVRALSRLALERGGPRDLAAIHIGLTAASAVAARMEGRGEASLLPDGLREAVRAATGVDGSLAAHLAAMLEPEPPLNKRDGGFIAQGFDPALDELRTLRDESRRIIAAMQTDFAQLSECRQLRVKYNHFLGYFIEVPQAFGERMVQPPLNATFIHRQTMADAMRFTTTELAAMDAKISSAADRALGLELRHFDEAVARILALGAQIRAASAAMAHIDVAAALADLAADLAWMRPKLRSDAAFIVEGGRHPVVEAALKAKGQSFVANNCDLGSGTENRVALVTGPNMAGKSTYLRQNALMVILTQMGSFVPAASAEIGVVDKLFSRVGAADDLARGRSTFMVEMVETAAILNQATAQSLVILDEIGRGTATYDGLSIAWASLEHLHESNKCRTLFATHFHELTKLQHSLPRLTNLTMRVTEWNGDVVFLHEVVAGAANRSYGIQVAKLAGLPRMVIERAAELLEELEAGKGKDIDDMLDDLPLFSSYIAPKMPRTSENNDNGHDVLHEAVKRMQPDELSPREALEALYTLKLLL